MVMEMESDTSMDTDMHMDVGKAMNMDTDIGGMDMNKLK
jgi:hypothetical protein